MKILVVGAKGMLGTMLMEILADTSPIGWDVADIDITKREQVQDKVLALSPDVIINAAAYTNVDKAETEREAAFAVNEVGPKNLAEVAKHVGATLVHYSTDYVFPGDNPEGYSEDDPAGPPVSVYGESKLAGEKAVLGSGANAYVVRTAWLYGPNGKNFVGTMLRLGKEKKELNVVSDQHGSPTFTKDVALATKQLLDEKKEFGIYHAVCGGQTTWNEFAEEIFRIAELDVNVNAITSAEYPVPAKRPAYSVLLNTKGLAMRDWKTALQDYMDTV